MIGQVIIICYLASIMLTLFAANSSPHGSRHFPTDKVNTLLIVSTKTIKPRPILIIVAYVLHYHFMTSQH